MKKCAHECVRSRQHCCEEECRLWINHKKDLNCSLISITRNGAMTLHEVAERLEMTHVRVKQIQDAAIEKIDKEEMRDELFVLPDGFF